MKIDRRNARQLQGFHRKNPQVDDAQQVVEGRPFQPRDDIRAMADRRKPQRVGPLQDGHIVRDHTADAHARLPQKQATLDQQVSLTDQHTTSGVLVCRHRCLTCSRLRLADNVGQTTVRDGRVFYRQRHRSKRIRPPVSCREFNCRETGSRSSKS